MSQNQSEQLLTAEDTAGAYSEKKNPWGAKMTFQASGATSAGAGAAAIRIYASDEEDPSEADDTAWVHLGTISLTLGTTKTVDGFAVDAPWRNVRAKLQSISGTNAAVDCWMGS